jgi:peptide subunit release factor RF-3
LPCFRRQEQTASSLQGDPERSPERHPDIGITIKAAVVSFTVGGLTVNLIDTPGVVRLTAE